MNCPICGISESIPSPDHDHAANFILVAPDRPPVSGEPRPDWPQTRAARDFITDIWPTMNAGPQAVVKVLLAIEAEAEHAMGRAFELHLEHCHHAEASTGAALDAAFLRRLADYPWGLHLAGTPNEAEAIGLIDELRARLAEQEGDR